MMPLFFLGALGIELHEALEDLFVAAVVRPSRDGK
jgi:hypothetical protein